MTTAPSTGATRAYFVTEAMGFKVGDLVTFAGNVCYRIESMQMTDEEPESVWASFTPTKKNGTRHRGMTPFSGLLVGCVKVTEEKRK